MTRRFALRAASLSADGRTFVASARAKAEQNDGRCDSTLRTGQAGARVVACVAAERSPAVSADGRRVRCSRRPIRVARPSSSRPRRAANSLLRGNYEVEALSPDGRRALPRPLAEQRVRAAAARPRDPEAQPDPSRRARREDERDGTSAIATSDGRWLLTLNVKPDGQQLRPRARLRSGIAHCIDLPLSGDSARRGRRRSTLSPDEQRLYLASPLLGRVTTVDMNSLEVTGSLASSPSLR